MKKLTSFTLFTALFAVVFTSVSCIRQEASPAETPATAAKAEDVRIRKAQDLIEQMPDSPAGYNQLAVAYIRRARETGDFGLNTKAEQAVTRALELDADNLAAKKLRASLLLTFHRFREALEFGTELQQNNPPDAFLYGVLTDANIELGNYPAAIESAQQMVDLRPDMSSYSRVSLVRSLHGDSPGAIEAMKTAARIADPQDPEAQAWCLVHLGDEFFKTGQYAAAEQQYEDAMRIFPDYHLALAGKGRARAAAGDYEGAIKFYTASRDRVPATRTVIELGNVYVKTGNPEEARKQFELAEAIEKSFGNTDLRQLALLWANRDERTAEALEIARREFENRRDIYTADIYAWCLYKNGDFEKAREVIGQALRLKTVDAQIFYHTGMIEKELGNRSAGAQFLQRALKTNPAFDLLQAEQARQALAEIN